jgi:hypothetical protein
MVLGRFHFSGYRVFEALDPLAGGKPENQFDDINVSIHGMHEKIVPLFANWAGFDRA